MNPVAIVTGAGSGIGRATAVMLDHRGYSVALVGRRESALRETESLLANPSLVVAVDIGVATACREVIAKTDSTFRRIDILVNNAGIAPRLPLERTDPAVIQAAFGVNALGPAYLIHYAWPVFVRQNRGCIVNVSTMATIDPLPDFFAYSASKASVNLMALSCARDGREYGIRAFSLAVGAVETTMLREIFPESVLPRDMTLSPDAVAKVILECLNGKHDLENGKTIMVTPTTHKCEHAGAGRSE